MLAISNVGYQRCSIEADSSIYSSLPCSRFAMTTCSKIDGIRDMRMLQARVICTTGFMHCQVRHLEYARRPMSCALRGGRTIPPITVSVCRDGHTVYPFVGIEISSGTGTGCIDLDQADLLRTCVTSKINERNAFISDACPCTI